MRIEYVKRKKSEEEECEEKECEEEMRNKQMKEKLLAELEYEEESEEKEKRDEKEEKIRCFFVSPRLTTNYQASPQCRTLHQCKNELKINVV